MFDLAVVFVYTFFLGVTAVSVGTILKPLFKDDEVCQTC